MSEYNVRLRSNYLDGVCEVDLVLPNPFVGHDPERFYRSGRKYPVLWLLHGRPQELKDWITYTFVPRLGIWRNVILVCPHCPAADFRDHEDVGEGYRYQQFFFRELMPFIQNWFPASAKREENLLAGYGSGGTAVCRYAALWPDRFGAVCPIRPSSETDIEDCLRQADPPKIFLLAADGSVVSTHPKVRFLAVPGDGLPLAEKTVEAFLEACGFPEIEKKPNTYPILPGVHDLPEEEGITIH